MEKAKASGNSPAAVHHALFPFYARNSPPDGQVVNHKKIL